MATEHCARLERAHEPKMNDIRAYFISISLENEFLGREKLGKQQSFSDNERITNHSSRKSGEFYATIRTSVLSKNVRTAWAW